MIANNVKNIRERIDLAAKNSVFDEPVTLIAVSKFRSVEELQQITACGITELGENRVQEMLEKYPHFEGKVNWHLIGTLQKNKVKYIIDKVSLIHSVDSIELAQEIDRQARKKNIISEILMQVNTAKEESKHGFDEEDLDNAIEALSKLGNIRVTGLMMIAPDTDDVSYLETLFIKTRNIFDNLMKKCSNYDNINFKILSMGMTNDFELAIQCGANMVRIGRALFS